MNITGSFKLFMCRKFHFVKLTKFVNAYLHSIQHPFEAIGPRRKEIDEQESRSLKSFNTILLFPFSIKGHIKSISSRWKGEMMLKIHRTFQSFSFFIIESFTRSFSDLVVPDVNDSYSVRSIFKCFFQSCCKE